MAETVALEIAVEAACQDEFVYAQACISGKYSNWDEANLKYVLFLLFFNLSFGEKNPPQMFIGFEGPTGTNVQHLL